MFGLEKYKHVFGRPGMDAHAWRIPVVDLAFVDVLFTALAAYVCSVVYANYSFLAWFGALMVLGIFMHALFGVQTKLNQTLPL